MGKIFDEYKRDSEALLASGVVADKPVGLDAYRTEVAVAEQRDFVNKGMEQYYAARARREAKNAAGNRYASGKEALDKHYGNVTKELKSQRNRAEQSANINYAKLMKYLPEQLKAAGLKGVGAGSGAYLAAANDLNNSLTEIAGSYSSAFSEAEAQRAAGLSELEASYAAGESAADSEYMRTMNEIASRYGAQSAARGDKLAAYIEADEAEKERLKLEDDLRKEENEKAETNAALTNFTEMLRNNEFSSSAEIQAAYDGFKDRLDPAMRSVMDKRVESEVLVFGEAENNDAEAKTVVTDDGIAFKKNTNADWNTDTFHITIGNEPYKIEALRIINDIEIKEAAYDVGKNKFFLYDDTLYFKNDAGDIVEIDPDTHTKGYDAAMRVLTDRAIANKRNK